MYGEGGLGLGLGSMLRRRSVGLLPFGDPDPDRLRRIYETTTVAAPFWNLILNALWHYYFSETLILPRKA